MHDLYFLNCYSVPLVEQQHKDKRVLDIIEGIEQNRSLKLMCTRNFILISIQESPEQILSRNLK